MDFQSNMVIKMMRLLVILGVILLHHCSALVNPDPDSLTRRDGDGADFFDGDLADDGSIEDLPVEDTMDVPDDGIAEPVEDEQLDTPEADPIADSIEEDMVEDVTEDELAEDIEQDDLPDDMVEEDISGEESPYCGDGEVEGEEECDDGMDGDPDDGCTDDCRYSCHNSDECDDGHDCTDNICDTASTHTCSYPLSTDSRICRPSVGECDGEEKCTGSHFDCPPDISYCWLQISAGVLHTCAVATDNSLYCWGSNSNGQLGIGTIGPNELRPVQVGSDINWLFVSGGGGGSTPFTCATKSFNDLYCWGDNQRKQLGIGSTEAYRTSPTRVGTGYDWSIINAGGEHACGIKTNNHLYCWGSNPQGQLGDGSTTTRDVPTYISPDS